jgi:MOSC domain-containing protein YiiM
MVDTAPMTTLHPASARIDATVLERVPDRGRDFASSLADVCDSPRDRGTLHSIVRRPARDRREVVAQAVLDLETGLVGDDWLARGSSSTPDGRANPDSQLTIMSVRVLQAIEPDEARWALAGDQLLVDLDLSIANLPPGARIIVGEAELVISETPHTGCAKFSGRFGSDALRWINSPLGRDLRLRGVNARVVRGGVIRIGDLIQKV